MEIYENFIKNNPHLKEKIDEEEFDNIASLIDEVRHLSIFHEEDTSIRADIFEAAETIFNLFDVEENKDAKILYENMKNGYVEFSHEFLSHFENLGFEVYNSKLIGNKIDEKSLVNKETKDFTIK